MSFVFFFSLYSVYLGVENVEYNYGMWNRLKYFPSIGSGEQLNHQGAAVT